MRKVKGMEVGIGFIITIIIAVMALVLAIQLLNPLFTQAGELGNEAIAGARKELLDSIRTDTYSEICKISLPPLKQSESSYLMSKSKTLSERPVIGLKNTGDTSKCYRSGVELVSIGNELAKKYFPDNEKCISAESCTDFNGLKDQASLWFRPSDPSVIRLDSRDFVDHIDLTTEVGTMKEGTYTFAFKVCVADPDPTGNCPSVSVPPREKCSDQGWSEKSCTPRTMTVNIVS